MGPDIYAFVIFERKGKNKTVIIVPIVTGYSEVIKSVQSEGIPIDSPANFKDRRLLFKQCREYLSSLNVDDKMIQQAFNKAESEQISFINTLVEYNKNILKHAGEDADCHACRTPLSYRFSDTA